MRILFAVAELAPYVTTGGLGNAVAGLAAAVARRGHRVTVAVPGYRDTGHSSRREGWSTVDEGDVSTRVFQHEVFDRPGVYGPEAGTGYEDNWYRYALFSRAVADASGDFDVVHLHDAHSAVAAMLMDVPSVLTIHNAAHQLRAPLLEAAETLGAPEEATYPAGVLEWFGGANFLKAGVVSATELTTVSPTHALELTEDGTSFGLAAVIRARERPIQGILNGIDTVSWDPARDPALPAPFSADRLEGRTASRAELLRRTGLGNGHLLGNVGRMSHQKGLALVEESLAELVAGGVRLVLVGNGELDPMVDGWVRQFPDAVVHLAYSPGLARLVSAGADAYLMPSSFEPSGLGQIYAMRYGAPPIVHFVGGLADTVIDADEHPDLATGFGFREHTARALAATIFRAVDVLEGDSDRWRRIQLRGMTTDWSWEARAELYEDVYESAAG